jgi:hypothetical protein
VSLAAQNEKEEKKDNKKNHFQTTSANEFKATAQNTLSVSDICNSYYSK